MRLPVFLAAAVSLMVSSASFAVNEATPIHANFPYYYTGYYQYGSSPYVVVPNFKINDANYSYLFSPYYYGYNQTGFYGKPVTRRPWSLGYMSDGSHGVYYY
jgi:hypothetical protein